MYACLYAHNPYMLDALLEFGSWKGFGKGICQYSFYGDIFQAYSSGFYAFPDEIMLDIDMFHFTVVDRVVSQGNS